MAKSAKVLTIDITNESTTILEITASKKQTMIHNAIIFETPEDSYEDGNIKNKDKIASAIRTQLNENGITNKNAIFVLSSTKVVNREVLIPPTKPGKIKDVINANAAEYFPVNIDDYIVSSSVLETVTGDDKNKQMRVLAVAAPTYMVKGYYDVAAQAGLILEDIDYIGNSMLQLIKTQTGPNATTMVIQLGSESTVLNIVKGETLLLQRTVPYGTSNAVQEVMDEKNVDAATAMTMLQNDRMVTVDFDDNSVTGAFRYLINNIGRVMDYYATKNPDKPIEEVYLAGDGALIKGLDGLFKVQLNVTTRIMDTLYGVKFDSKIDLKIYNPVYLIAPIGAAFEPMGFSLSDAGGKKTKAGGGSSAAGIAVFAVCALVAAGAYGGTWYLKKQSQDKKDDLNRKIEAIKDIDEVVTNYNNAKAKYEDMYTMVTMTENLNENAITFINGLEETMPKAIKLESFNSTESGVTIMAMADTYDDIGKWIMTMRDIDCVTDTFVNTITEVEDETTGSIKYETSVTALFVSTVEPEDLDVVDEGDSSEAAEETTEATEAAQ
ncbi:MAG: pilus assembly protein PilM [Lachnospiraceae bacterium]|nr:pilus assembly protein PilM [Lachnospiraceae bacterium]